MPPFVHERVDVFKGLRLRATEISAKCFVFDDEIARPEEIDEAVVPCEFLYWRFERGDGLAGDAEHVEELVPEGLFLASFARGFGVLIGELDRTMSNFVPGKGHVAREYCKRAGKSN